MLLYFYELKPKKNTRNKPKQVNKEKTTSVAVPTFIITIVVSVSLCFFIIRNNKSRQFVRRPLIGGNLPCFDLDLPFVRRSLIGEKPTLVCLECLWKAVRGGQWVVCLLACWSWRGRNR